MNKRDTGPEDERLEHHRGHDHIGAIFPSRGAATDAIAELRLAGLGSEHLGIAAHQRDQVIFEDDEVAELAHDAIKGTAIGAGVGYLAGLALFAVAVPGFGVGGLLALASSTAFGGGAVGGFIGLGEGQKLFTEHLEFETRPLAPGEILVVACSHDRPDAVRSALQDHGGQLIDSPD